MGEIVASPNPHFFQPLTSNNCLLNFSIPKSFLKYIGGTKDESIVILRDKQKLNWYVKMVGHEFKEGWDKFCKENKMEVGDFVVFTHQGHLTFDVFVFDPSCCEREIAPKVHQLRNQIDASTTNLCRSITHNKLMKALKEKKNEEKKDALKEEVGFKPSGLHPFWQTLYKQYSSTWGGMVIPKAFAKENGLTKRWCELVLIDAKTNQPYQMTLKHYKKNTPDGCGGPAYIGGWGQFHRAIGLKIGDVLTFELLDNGKIPVIRLHVEGGTKASSDENLSIVSFSKGKVSRETCITKRDLNEGTTQMVEIKGLKDDASSEEVGFKPFGPHPFWQIVYEESYLRWGGLPIPKDFAKENGLTKRWCELVLIDAKENRPYQMTLRHRKKKTLDGCGGPPYIGGSRRFQRTVGLKSGNVLIFELLDNGKIPVVRLHVGGGTTTSSNKKLLMESFDKGRTVQKTLTITTDVNEGGENTNIHGKELSIQISNIDKTLKETSTLLALEDDPTLNLQVDTHK